MSQMTEKVPGLMQKYVSLHRLTLSKLTGAPKNGMSYVHLPTAPEDALRVAGDGLTLLSGWKA
jgi:hypothetical protein